MPQEHNLWRAPESMVDVEAVVAPEAPQQEGVQSANAQVGGYPRPHAFALGLGRSVACDVDVVDAEQTGLSVPMLA